MRDPEGVALCVLMVGLFLSVFCLIDFDQLSKPRSPEDDDF